MWESSDLPWLSHTLVTITEASSQIVAHESAYPCQRCLTTFGRQRCLHLAGHQGSTHTQVNWLLFFLFFFFFGNSSALGPTVILRALTSLDKIPETGGLSCVLGFVGFVSFLCPRVMDSDQLMDGPVAAVVIFLLLMCMKCL